MKQKLIHHHIKYQEVHGTDEVILLTPSEHVLLHKRLRKEGKCNISPEKLRIISKKASRRLDHIIGSDKQWRQSEHGKEKIRAYDKSPKRRDWHNQYIKDFVNRFEYTTTLETNIQLFETFIYNTKTDCFRCSTRFHSTKGKLRVIRE